MKENQRKIFIFLGTVRPWIFQFEFFKELTIIINQKSKLYKSIFPLQKSNWSHKIKCERVFKRHAYFYIHTYGKFHFCIFLRYVTSSFEFNLMSQTMHPPKNSHDVRCKIGEGEKWRLKGQKGERSRLSR